MGNQASSTDARSLRAQLVGVDRVQQHAIAYQWAKANGKLIDLLGDYAKQRGLLLFRSVLVSPDDDIIVIDAEITKK